MKYYLAPLEGITGYVFRNVWHQCFGEADKYVTPFISPNRKKICRTREKKDILPEHNEGMRVVPQILTNHPDVFIKTAEYLGEYGYREVNLNLGCPVGTVTAKKKGAGFLADTEQLQCFFDRIFSHCDMKISVKTRIGLERPEEFEKLLLIFNQFPLHELIIHPRTRADYYKNTPNMDAFSLGYEKSRAEVCYNGDIFTVERCASIENQFPRLPAVMLGRGILRNPGLMRQIRNGTIMRKDELRQFHDRLYESYRANDLDGQAVLFKMKELWSYMIYSFRCVPELAKIEKRVKKAKKQSEYEMAVQQLFSCCELDMEEKVTDSPPHETVT